MFFIGEELVGLDDPLKGKPAFSDAVHIDVAEVVAVAGLIEEGRIFSTGKTGGGEVIKVLWEGRVAELLEWFIGAPAETDGCAFKEAERGVEINGLHIGQVGRGFYG